MQKKALNISNFNLKYQALLTNRWCRDQELNQYNFPSRHHRFSSTNWALTLPEPSWLDVQQPSVVHLLYNHAGHRTFFAIPNCCDITEDISACISQFSSTRPVPNGMYLIILHICTKNRILQFFTTGCITNNWLFPWLCYIFYHNMYNILCCKWFLSYFRRAMTGPRVMVMLWPQFSNIVDW